MSSPFNVKRDKVVYENKAYFLKQWPLQTNEILFKKLVKLRKKYECGYQSNSSSGFSCSWKIDKGSLYLTKIELMGCNERVKSLAVDGVYALVPKSPPLNELFDKAQEKVFAVWFSGKLEIILNTQRLEVNEQNIALFESKVLLLMVEKGKIISTSEIKKESYKRRVLNDYIEE